jgi:acyl carrier protein
MVPALWVQLESLPLTSNGKIDKKALPDPTASELLSNEYVAPRNKIEISLAKIWQDLLGIERIGINDNFFELGGHSLLAMRLISLIRKRMEVEIAINDIFEFTTISDLSKYLEIQLNPQEEDSKEFELLDI